MEPTLNKPTLLSNESPLQVLPSLAIAIGLNEAIILQHFYSCLVDSTDVIDGRKWIHNSYKAWNKQFPFMSLSTLRRTINKLENLGVLVSGNYNRSAFDNTKWYTIDLNKVDELIAQYTDTIVQPENKEVENHDEPEKCSEAAAANAQPEQANTNKLPETTPDNYIYTTHESWIKHGFEELWSLYPRKTGKTRALKAFTKWIQEDSSHTIEYMKERIEKYLVDLEIDYWKQPMGGGTFFEGRFDDHFKTASEYCSNHRTYGYRKRKPVQIETLPDWAKDSATDEYKNNDPQEVVSDEEVNEKLAKLRQGLEPSLV